MGFWIKTSRSILTKQRVMLATDWNTVLITPLNAHQTGSCCHETKKAATHSGKVKMPKHRSVPARTATKTSAFSGDCHFGI